MPSRIANEVHLNTVRPLIGSHYPPEYHSFMYSADLGKLPRSNTNVENYMFYDSATGAWTCVMPIMLVARTTIIDAASIMIISSGLNNDGNAGPFNGGFLNYGWMKAQATSVTLASSDTVVTASGTATASWTAGSKTLTLTGVTGTPAIGDTIKLNSPPSQDDAAQRATPNTFGVTAVAGGAASVTMSHAPTASGSAAVTFYPRRPISQLNTMLYCNSANEPYLVYGDPVTGATLNSGGFGITYPNYDTGADTSLLGPEAWGGESGPPYMDYPSTGENWGAAASYQIINNCCVVDRAGGGDRGQGKALALVWYIGYGNISPAQVRDRLQGVRFLVTIRHRSSVTGGKGG